MSQSALTIVLLGALPIAASAAAAGTARHAERPGIAEVRVARDPETGEWGLAPLGTDAAALDRAPSFDAQMAINQSQVGLVAETQPDGSLTLDVQGRFQNYSIARKDVTGAIHFDCSQDPVSLYAWLTSMPEPVDAYGRPVR